MAERAPAWRRRSPPWRALLVGATLAGATLAICWPLGLTNRILAGVDAFTYFMPYWAYRMAELRVGHLPLWNPYLFLGAPFLANPQAAVLYPLHWLLNGLAPAQALVWSALLHVWLAAGLMYVCGRRTLGLSRPAAWLAAALFALGGFTLGKIENINQLNTLAWLPGLLWSFDAARRAVDWRGRLRAGVALSAMMALQLLAGHTQTAFVNLVGLGIFALFGGSADRRIGASADRRISSLLFAICYLPSAIRRLAARLWPLLAILPALALAAAQLLPTLELNGLGLRTGGLSYRLAVSFSLRPRLLAQTFLPPVGSGLAETFGSEGYAEFTGYIGVVGLILAAAGVAGLLRRPRADCPPGRAALVGLAIVGGVGVFLALGAYNPFYYLLWRFAPGFDLFRAPARWLALYAVAAAGLAGAGLDVMRHGWRERRLASPASRRGSAGLAWSGDQPGQGDRPQLGEWWAVLSRAARRPGAIIGALAFILFLVSQQPMALRTWLGWSAAASLACALACAGRRWPRPALVGLIALALAELWLGGRALPFALATAPAAASWRNAPAALLAATAAQPPAGRDRFLSMSDIRYDPGDLAELRALQADRLPAEAVERFVRAAKWTEVIAPNLSVAWRLPALDGYDGGVLPTADYGRLQTLFVPAEARLPDGRLREQLRAMPPARLLDLTGVRFVITDKQRDLWDGDVYYDLEQPAALGPGERLTLTLAAYPPFAATALGVVAAAERGWPSDGAAHASISVTDAQGQAVSLPLTPQPPDAAPCATLLSFGAAMTPTALTVAVAEGAPAGLIVRGLSLFDGRTAAHQSITLSPRGDLQRIHSGDVKVYERTVAPGRVWLVHGVRAVADQEEAWRALAAADFDPTTTVLLAGDFAAQAPGAALPGESAQVIAFEAERVAVRVEVRQPAFLVLADAFYPGWTATVAGVPTPVLRANGMFRAVALPPGAHDVVFAYEPVAWRRGAAISLAACALLALAAAASLLPQRGQWR